MPQRLIPIIIPCHRVVCSDGTLWGLYGGSRLEEKIAGAGESASRAQEMKKRAWIRSVLVPLEFRSILEYH
jgi:hypothetical protein